MTSIPGLRAGEFQGFPALLVETPYSRAAISLFGAHLMSFVPKGHTDLMWMSPTTRRPPEGIRGGVPICWPWFAKQGQSPDAQQHGLVRRTQWQMSFAQQQEDGTVDLAFNLANPAVHHLQLLLSMRIGRSLGQSLTTVNSGDAPFPLTQALHTYFKVGDVEKCRIEGLDGLEYTDKFSGMQRMKQSSPHHFAVESDRIYHATNGRYALIDEALRRRIVIESTGSKTLVVWNPGANHVQNFNDIDHARWRDFFCLEVANAGDEVIHLAPGESHQITQSLSAEAL